jgi:hypothetical protein
VNAGSSAEPGTGKAPAASAWLSLLASSSTLICCALPALLVTLGAGAALSSLVSVFPQIVFLSEHKGPLFGIAALMLAAGGWLQWRNRYAPCPIDPALRDACLRTRKQSLRIWWVAVVLMLIGAWFAFVQPWLAAAE